MIPKLQLRAKPSQPTQVNKPVVLAVAATIVLSILLAIIYAFSGAKNIKIPSSSVKAPTNKPLVFSSELNDLPGSYSDVNGIQRYSPGGSQLEVMARLQQQLNDLKGSYELLEEQLRMNQQEPGKKNKSPQDENAKNSSVVFPGLGGGDKLISPNTDKATSDKTSDKISELPQEAYDLKPLIDPKIVRDVQPKAKILQAGTIIQATLITGIESTLAGTIVAQVRQDLYDTITGKYKLIPKGSKLLGEYDSRTVSYGQRRIAMWYTRIIRPDGTSIMLGRPAGADLLGQAGVEGNVDNHWARIIGAATISTLLSVGTAMWANRTTPTSQTVNGITSNQQNAAAGAGQAISNVGEQIAAKSLGVPPAITLPPGYQFTITVKKDMVLPPFKSGR